ncbi:hypothetical protein Trydic_g7900 [Trypoxylus dichotomus]
MRGAYCTTEVKAERRANIRSKRANVGRLFTQLAHRRAIVLLTKMNCATLIGEVYCRKPLWDSLHPQHHNRTVLDKLWEEVSQTMQFPVKDVRKKWKYLRDQYRKELKKIPKNEDGSWTCQPSWPYFQSLEFLTPEMSFDDVSGSTTQNVTNSNFNEVSRGTVDDEEEEILPDSPLNSSETIQEVSKNRAPKRKPPSSNNEFNEKLLKLEEKKLELLAKQQTFIDEERSDDYHFFMSLLPVMQKFNDLQRFRIRSKFQSIIIEEISKAETCEHTDTKIFGLEN